MIDLRAQELSIVSQMLHLQLALQIGELEQLTIQSESRCERDREKFILSSWEEPDPICVKPQRTVSKKCAKCSKDLTPEDRSSFFSMYPGNDYDKSFLSIRHRRLLVSPLTH